MGRRFVLSGENMTINPQNILAALQTGPAGAAASIIEIERVEITQSHNATSAQARIGHGLRTGGGTLTCSAATPHPLGLTGPVSGLSGNTNITIAATCGVNASADYSGLYTDTLTCAPNNQGGYLWTPTERDGKLVIPPSTVYVVRFFAVPSDTAGWTINVIFHEYM